MDLSVVYTKTAKGLRARASLLGGLPSHLMKVLTHIDGTSKAETILVSLEEITEQKLVVALNLLEREGYIKPVIATVPSEYEWAPATIFAPMEVEEYENVEEVEVKAKESAWQEAQRKVKAEEEARQQAEIKAREKEAQAQEKAKTKEKIKAEAKVKAQLEADRISREKEDARKKAEAEANAKIEAKSKAENEAREKEVRKAKEEEEARLKAEAEEKAKIEQKEHVRREIERIARETEEAEQRKVEEAARAKAEAARIKAEEEARIKAEEAMLLAERQVMEAAQKAKQAELKVQEEAHQARAKAEAEAKENARRELERINRDAEEAQKKAEAQARAKAEEEARLKVEAEEKARQQVEIKAREKEAQALEKERLKAEAEGKAKALAEEKAREKDRDRQEIARIVREAEDARKKAEAQAKEERQEAKRKAKAEQDARMKVERKPKDDLKQAPAKVETPAEIKVEVEENASVDANLNASLAMQYFVTNDTEEIEKPEADANLDAEKGARVNVEKAQFEAARKAGKEIEAEQIRANAEVEEQTKARAKENARLEMERISREADAARLKHEAEAKAGDEATVKEVTKSRTWEEIEADEERTFKEEEEANKKAVPIVKDEKVAQVIEEITHKEAERLSREDIKRLAKEEAEARAKTYAKRSVRLLNYGRWLEMAKRVLLVYLPLVVFLLISVLHFINISPLIEPIEKLATESVGASVTINEVHASLWPQPHLVLDNVVIGNNDSLKIEAINVLPDTSSILEEVKLVKSLEFEGLKITQDNFEQPQPWVNSLGKAKHLKIEQINLKKIVLQIRDLEIGTFDGKVEFTDLRELKSYHLNSNTLSAQITPQGSSFDVALTGTNWSLPMNPKVVFDEFKANGTLNQTQINFMQIEGNIYGGNIKAKAAVDWSSEWSIAGNFDLFNATLPRLLSAFGSGASIDGKLELAGLFSSRSARAALLVDAPEMVARFEVLGGKINGVDLTRAVLFRNHQSLTGEPTHFDTLTGNVELKSGTFQYRQLALDTAQFHAKGNLDIQSNQDISGKVSADLAAQSRRLQARFDLAGKVGAVQRQ
jgi:AsmA-like C-terminal region